ncbi:Hypothetical predicted protein [Paramuricea clavata]|uniref:DUF4795 domain-containing protein n=1 Tax=Paramuricea clavata TaxID=317549 RepID=A0A6S7H6J7_PARCT|nr:Hypothetical predicted protein [Paramuricea clavata]
MSAGMELDKLLNLALGTPEIGAVNFNALHGVLSEIIKTLGVGSKLVEVRNNGDFSGSYGTNSVPVAGKGFDSKRQAFNAKTPLSQGLNGLNLEAKVTNLENKLKALDDLPNNADIVKRIRERDTKTAVGDIWQFININRRLSATEDAIEKLSGLLEHAISELGGMKDLERDLSELKKSVTQIQEENKQLKQRLETVEDSDRNEDIKKLKILQEDVENLHSKVESLPTKKDFDVCMKWPQFESALKSGSSNVDSNKAISREEVPSVGVLDTIKQLGSIADGHETVLNSIEGLQETMPTKADKEDLEELRKKTQELPDDLIRQLNELNTKMKNMINWKDEMINKSNEDLNEIEQSMREFRENLQKLNISTRNLIEDGDKKQKHIDKLHSVTEVLDQTKADKDSVGMEMDTKADKLALDNMISRLKFDASFGTLEHSVQDILNRLAGQEAALQEAVSKLNNEVDEKMDRMEMDPLKDYINKRIKANKCKHVDLPVTDDSAAGMTKPAIKFHCISCAKPIDVQPGMNAIPLPQYPAFPPSKSSRPYAPYELEQMRQHARGNYDGADHMSTRPCGGQHTMTYSARRVNKNVNYYYREDEGVIISLKNESPVQGHDGQLYKGREYSEQFPTLQQSQTSPQSPPKPPAGPSNPQTSPRPHTPVRARSAVIR